MGRRSHIKGLNRDAEQTRCSPSTTADQAVKQGLLIMHTPTLKNGYGALRSVFEAAYEENGNGYSRTDLTVLSAQVDPYRLDTPAGHRDGKWALAQLARAFGKHGRTHWRGRHYAIVARGNIRKPDGDIYRNTEADWLWLSNVAGKAARWLGYIPFERITDNRNAPPVIHRKARVQVETWVSIGLDVDIPGVDEHRTQTGRERLRPKASLSVRNLRRERFTRRCAAAIGE